MVGRAVHHVSINVTDTEPARVFYEHLGFTPIKRPELGFPGAWLRLGTTELHLLELPPPDARGQHFSLHVENLDTALESLRRPVSLRIGSAGSTGSVDRRS